MFSLGDAKLGVTYTSVNDEIQCVIYENYKQVASLPVVVPWMRFKLEG